MGKKNCTICNSEMIEQDVENRIFRTNNYYCKACNSFHITEEQDLSEYYSKQYHNDFSFKATHQYHKILYKYQNPRALSRFNYLKKVIADKDIQRIIEIGGGNGDNFKMLNLLLKPESYLIIEPNTQFNIKQENIKYLNRIFEDVEDVELPQSDILILFHVFEHFYNINSFIERTKRINTKYVYIEVPNIANPLVKQESLKNHPHYHHFSIESLKTLFKKHNIKNYKIDGILPLSYHPYKKINPIKRIVYKTIGRNEILNEKGPYIRVIFQP